MEAYNIGELALKLKSKGLDVAEEGAKVAVESVIEWLEESAMASSNPYDNLLIALYPIVKQKALEQVDKIDGAQG
jgi:hypothetical protein